jgi:peroxidase
MAHIVLALHLPLPLPLLLLFSQIILLLIGSGVVEGQGDGDELRVGFYSNTCPQVESTVRGLVRDAALSDPNIPPVLLRLHFHDCFVQGCDGSILIDNGVQSEKRAFGHQGVRGFDIIEKAKAQLEASCPGVVSCADIVALAARDAIALVGTPNY